MGEVWLAEDTRLRRRVALKMVRPAVDTDPGSRERLMREARAAAALNHPHIATVHDVLEQDGDVVIVFEHVEGETLHARIARGRIAAADAVEIATQIAKALSAAHGHGIIHRDLKPANVIVGADHHVKVLDFGIARILAVGTTQSSPGETPHSASGIGFIGTAGYAAPEQMVSSAVDERADLYALGVVLFEMLSGRRPFEGSDPIQLASTKLRTDAPPLSSTGTLVPPALEQLVASLLSRERDDRLQTARDVLARLRAISGEKGTGPLPEPRSRSPLTAIAAAVLLVVVAGFGLREVRRFTAVPVTNSSAPPVIAVLPLTNNSGDASKDFLASGIAESLVSSLASLPSVTVLSRAAVAEARARASDFKGIVKELGAAYLVQGGVEQSGETVRVALNLVKADQSVIWASAVETRFDDLFSLQSRLANELTSNLVVRMSPQERQMMERPPTSNPDALRAYWQGTALLERDDVKGNVDAAISSFERALSHDPNCALAHAGLGQAYRRRYIDTRDPGWAQRAIEEASIALRMDPDRPEVRYALAVTYAGSGRTKEAVEELQGALAVRPNYEDARRLLGQVLAQQGQIEAAIAEFRKAIALRPTSASGYGAMGLVLYGASRYQDAAQAFAEAIKVAPDSHLGYAQLGTVYQAMGRDDEALANYRKSIAIRPTAGPYTNMGALLHKKGDFEGALKAHQEALALRPGSAITRRNIGDALLRLGRSAEARLAYLEAAKQAETDVKVNPTDARALASLAVYLQKSGQPDAAHDRISQALKLAPGNAEVLYRSAVVQVLSNNSEAALRTLETSVTKGFSRESIRNDDDWVSMRRDPRFTKLLSGETK